MLKEQNLVGGNIRNQDLRNKPLATYKQQANLNDSNVPLSLYKIKGKKVENVSFRNSEQQLSMLLQQND